MRRLWLVPIALLVLLVPVAVMAGGASGFDGVVSSLEGRYHIHASRIPFLGLVSFISKRATHDGVSNLRIAEFESFSESVDGDELNRMVEEKLGRGWERIIRETTRMSEPRSTDPDHRGGRRQGQTLIFAHVEGEKVGLFIVDLDGREMNVVQVSVDPDHLNESINRYNHHHARGHDRDQDTSVDRDSDSQRNGNQSD